MYDVSSSRLHLNDLQFNMIISGISSFMFFTGWWLMADVDINEVLFENRTYYIPGLVSTFTFFLINIVPAHYFYDSFTYQTGCFSPAVARTYLFVCLMISFGSLIGSFFILVNDFMLQPEKLQWPGYGICLQNTLIFISCMLLRFAKKRNQFY